MLRVICNRCEGVIGDLKEDGIVPGRSKFTPFLFDEATKGIVGANIRELDLCEKCARELTQAVIGWLPDLGEVQKKWNAEKQAEADNS